MDEEPPFPNSTPSCNDTLLTQLAHITSILTFLFALLVSLLLYIRSRRTRKNQLRQAHLESNAHISGMQEISWAIAAVKDSIKETGDGSEGSKEVYESVSRLLGAAEREMDVLTRERLGGKDVESLKSGSENSLRKGGLWGRWRGGSL